MRLIIKNFLLMTIAAFAVVSTAADAQFFGKKTRALLPEDQAFDVIAFVENGQLAVNWSIADDYYMYREQFFISSSDPDVTIGDITFPKGLIENDPEFGEVEVYFFNAQLTADISHTSATNRNVELTIRGQGCNKPVGVCYPPLTRTLFVDMPPSNGSSTNQNTADNSLANTPVNDDNRKLQPKKSFWSYVLAAFGAGILLSFTPCVLPMIPILAGVIAGQQNPSKLKSGWLAICYVAGTIVTYLLAGWMAGATGTQLQAHFQNPWVIGSICMLLILLATSLFGWFKIELPSSIQSKLTGTTATSRSASVSSFVLGLISALVVGACVSPVLILALGAAITQGDPLLGAAIMGAMAMGMGLLLILFGFGAGWILPKTGAWMQSIQVLFAFMVLGVAIYLASAFPSVPNLYLWAALLLCTGFYIWQMATAVNGSLMISVLRAIGLACLLWGVMALLGGASGGSDVLRPLDSLKSDTQNTVNRSVTFQSTTTLEGAQKLLADAKAQGKPALVDFYADWCLDCKRMHKTTFKRTSVISALEPWTLIEIDVTQTSDDSEKAKQFFNVFGPPATLFFKADGNEHHHLRQYGYLSETDFLNILSRAGE